MAYAPLFVNPALLGDTLHTFASDSTRSGADDVVTPVTRGIALVGCQRDQGGSTAGQPKLCD